MPSPTYLVIRRYDLLDALLHALERPELAALLRGGTVRVHAAPRRAAAGRRWRGVTQPAIAAHRRVVQS